MNQLNQSNLNRPTKCFTAIFRIVIAVFMLFFLGVLSMQALTGTTGMENIGVDQTVSSVVQYIREQIESVIYYQDNVLANLIFLVVGFVAVWLLMPRHLPLWAESLVLALWTIVLGFLWVRSSQVAPSEDSWTVSQTAWDFAKDNYERITGDNRYFRNYPFQLGFVFFEEILIRIAYLFKEDLQNLVFIQEISVILLASSYVAILGMLDQIFEDKRIRHTAFVLLGLCIQPMISCTFLYGIVPGFAFAAWAVCLEIRFLRSESWKGKILWGILSALCVTLSVVIKSNNLIVLVAMVLLAGVTAFQNKKTLCNLILVVASVIPCTLAPDAVVSMYEKRAGTEFGDSIPMISWFAMGMNEGISAPGWYNYGATVSNFEICEFNAEAASERSVGEIKNRLEYFSEHKQYRNDFFYKKYVSVWNETSYQSIWNNKVRGQYNPKTGIAKWICEEKELETKQYMDYFAQLIFILCFCGILYCLKQKNTYAMMIPLIVLGGMMYHLLAEAKSQYALPYFVWMTAFASCGFVFLTDKIKPCLSRQTKKKSEDFENPVESNNPELSESPEETESVPENPEDPEMSEEVELILKDLENSENGA